MKNALIKALQSRQGDTRLYRSAMHLNRHYPTYVDAFNAAINQMSRFDNS